MNIHKLYSLFLDFPVITSDSRNCIKDSVFFALRGNSFNGNRYAKEAVEKGCRYAIVDEKEFADEQHIFYVEDSLKALQELARKHRETLKTTIIGITGTNGKTTTKELIAAVLQKKYTILYTEGNLNNHIGVPLTLLKLKKEHEIAVIEMGANHPGEIKELCGIALPDTGLITNIGKAHLEGFGSLEGVIKTKSELYDHIRKHHGKIFINNDNEILRSVSQEIDKITYGTTDDCFIKGEIYESQPFLSLKWKEHLIRTNLVGNYNFENLLASIAVGSYYHVSETEITKAIENYTPQNNRSQYKETAENKLIIDAYNANPTSMKASLDNFLQIPYPDKTVILGDMKELGAESAQEHQAIVNLLSQASLTRVFLIGPCFKRTETKFPVFDDADAFLLYLKKSPIKNSMILIKGSNSMKLMKIVDFL